MENHPLVQALSDLAPDLDTSAYTEVRVVDGHELQNYRPGEGWAVLKIIQRDRVLDVQKTYPYQLPGCQPQTYCYQDKLVLREVSFIIARRENSVLEDLNRSLNDANSRAYSSEQESRKVAERLDRTLKEKLEGESKAVHEIARLEARLQEEKTEKEKAQTAYGIVFKEHESLKDTLLKTLVKLPGGNEASLTEAISMVKTHEILGGIKP